MLVIAAVLLMALGFYSQHTMMKLSNRTATVLRENYDSVRFMDEILDATAEEDRYLVALFASSRETSVPAEARVIQRYTERLENAIWREKNNITIAGERELAEQLENSIRAHREALWTFLGSFPPPDSRLARYEVEVRRAQQTVHEGALAIRNLNQDNMEAAASRTASSVPRYVAVGTMIAVLALLGAGGPLARRLIRQARELQALRTHFVAIASHELRTPVTSLRMGLDLLAKESVGALNEEQKTIATAGLDDCDRLLALSRQLLDVTKIQSGQLPIHRGATDLNSLVANAIGMLRRSLQEKRITVTLDLDAAEHQAVNVDPVKTTWVLTNILANAIRYSAAGEEISISATPQRNEVRVSVSDTGPGISPELARRVFQPYFQSKTTDAGADEKSRGTAGLGLTIAQEIVAAQGGRIWIEPKPLLGRGATVTFTLPLAEET